MVLCEPTFIPLLTKIKSISSEGGLFTSKPVKVAAGPLCFVEDISLESKNEYLSLSFLVVIIRYGSESTDELKSPVIMTGSPVQIESIALLIRSALFLLAADSFYVYFQENLCDFTHKKTMNYFGEIKKLLVYSSYVIRAIII
jgi:hypothetical protein